MTKRSLLITALGLAIGLTIGAVIQNRVDNAQSPRVVYTGTNWTMPHVPMPVCPDDHKRTVDIPERDEVDAFTITCKAVKP